MNYHNLNGLNFSLPTMKTKYLFLLELVINQNFKLINSIFITFIEKEVVRFFTFNG